MRLFRREGRAVPWKRIALQSPAVVSQPAKRNVMARGFSFGGFTFLWKTVIVKCLYEGSPLAADFSDACLPGIGRIGRTGHCSIREKGKCKPVFAACALRLFRVRSDWREAHLMQLAVFKVRWLPS